MSVKNHRKLRISGPAAIQSGKSANIGGSTADRSGKSANISGSAAIQSGKSADFSPLAADRSGKPADSGDSAVVPLLETLRDLRCLLPLGILGTLFSASNGLESTFLPLLAQEREIPHISCYFTFYILILILTKPLTAKLADRKGFLFVLHMGLLLMVAECLLLRVGTLLSVLLLAAGLKALGQGTTHPCLQAECIRHLGYEKSGTASSIFLLFTDLGQGAAPVLAGYIAGIFSFSAVFAGCALLYAVALLIVFLSDRDSHLKKG